MSPFTRTSLLLDTPVRPWRRHGLGLAALSVVLTLTACDKPGRGSTATVGVAQVSVDSTPVLDLPGSSAKTPLFGMIVGAVELPGGDIVVADAAGPNLQWFSDSGVPVRTVGRAGDGPGEFRRIQSIQSCGVDSLYVWDDMLARVSVLTGAGTFVRTFKLPGRPGLVACGDPDHFAVLMVPDGVRIPDPGGKAPHLRASLYLVNGTGDSLAAIDSVAAFENRPLGRVTYLAASPSRLFIATGDSAFVEMDSLDGHPAGGVPAGRMGRAPSTANYAASIDLQLSQLSPGPDRDRIRQFMLAIPMPAVLPPYFGAWADPAGTLWVQSSPPGAGMTTLQIAGRGESSQITLRGDLHILLTGTDKVIASAESEDGTPHLLIYRLHRR